MVVRVVFHDSSSPLKENIFVRSVRILQLAWMFTKDYGGSFLLASLLRCLMERVRCYREEIFYASNKTYCRQFLFFENGKRSYFISFFFSFTYRAKHLWLLLGGEGMASLLRSGLYAGADCSCFSLSNAKSAHLYRLDEHCCAALLYVGCCRQPR